MDNNIKIAKDLIRLAQLLVADNENQVEEQGEIDKSEAKSLLKDLENSGDNFEDEIEELGEELEEMKDKGTHRIVASKVITAAVAQNMIGEIKEAAQNVILTASIYKNAKSLKTAGFWDSFNKSRKEQINPDKSFTKKAKDALIKAVKNLIDKLVKILKSIALCTAGVAYLLIKGAITIINATCKSLIKMGVLAEKTIKSAFDAVVDAFNDLLDEIKKYRDAVKELGQEAIEKLGEFRDFVGRKAGKVVGVVQNELMGIFA